MGSQSSFFFPPPSKAVSCYCSTRHVLFIPHLKIGGIMYQGLSILSKIPQAVAIAKAPKDTINSLDLAE